MAYSFSSFDQHIKDGLEHFAQQLNELRTGRANTQMLDSVRVQAYGGVMKINELAELSAPDPNLLVIKPWDRSVLGEIEKAISSSGLNLSPVVDGAIIRIAVPALTAERRQEMVKIVSQRTEAGLVMLRNIRTDTKKEIDAQKGQPGISEDNIAADLKNLDDKFQKVMEQVEEMAEAKKADLVKI